MCVCVGGTGLNCYLGSYTLWTLGVVGHPYSKITAGSSLHKDLHGGKVNPRPLAHVGAHKKSKSA